MASAPHRVLIVESDELIRLLAEEWLASAGYEVVAISQPGECPAGCKVDAIVADLPAPRANGSDTVALLRRICGGAPVVATSACFMKGVGGCVDAAKRLDVAHVLPKPYTREQLLSLVGHTVQDAPEGRRDTGELRLGPAPPR